MKIIQIDNKDLVADLEVSYYEYNSYVNMLKEAKNNGYNSEYWSLWEQYMEVCSEYETLKEHIRAEYVVPAVGENYPGTWEVNFDNQEIYIYDENGQ